MITLKEARENPRLVEELPFIKYLWVARKFNSCDAWPINGIVRRGDIHTPGIKYFERISFGRIGQIDGTSEYSPEPIRMSAYAIVDLTEEQVKYERHWITYPNSDRKWELQDYSNNMVISWHGLVRLYPDTLLECITPG